MKYTSDDLLDNIVTTQEITCDNCKASKTEYNIDDFDAAEAFFEQGWRSTKSKNILSHMLAKEIKEPMIITQDEVIAGLNHQVESVRNHIEIREQTIKHCTLQISEAEREKDAAQIDIEVKRRVIIALEKEIDQLTNTTPKVIK